MTDHPEAPATVPRQSRGRAVGFYALAALFGLVTLVLGDASGNSDGGAAIGLGLAAFVFLMMAFAMGQRAQRHGAPLADQVLASDGRPPILYLRSFEDDQALANQEESLASVVEELGPFVAIGRPGEALPRLGAARKYLGNAEWQPYVREMLERSKLVFMLAGKTEGLGWEVAESFRRLDPRRLVVLVPDDADAYESFRTRASREGMSMPEFPARREKRYSVGGVVGLVHFEEGWDGRLQTFEKATFRGQSHELAGSSNRNDPRLRLALQPVYEGLGLDLRPPRRNWTLVAFLVYAGLALAFLGVMIWLFTNGRLD